MSDCCNYDKGCCDRDGGIFGGGGLEWIIIIVVVVLIFCPGIFGGRGLFGGGCDNRCC